MNKKEILGALLLASCLSAQTGNAAFASGTRVVPAGGKAISDNLIGIFFEDISMAADGGINADLVQNGSFEYSPTIRDGWGPGTCWKFIRPGHSAGYIQSRMDNAIHPYNPTYMRIHAERVGNYYDFAGWNGVGMQNDGYNGMTIKAGEKYDFSVFARLSTTALGSVEKDSPSHSLSPTGTMQSSGKSLLRVVLLEAEKEWGKEGGKILAEDTIVIDRETWDKYACTLTASADSKDASLRLLLLDEGDMDVDMVSLVPEDTYHGHGLRKDLCEALEALHPQFMRFPGGCVVHGGGDGFWDTYRWKTTVGPKQQRRALKNTWGYCQSMEVGYYEYFLMCEDMKMQPLPILPCGVSCQGVNGGWGMKDQAQKVVAMADMDEWAQDVLDLIEWANGDVTTKWGKVRADAGHPQPFNLRYVGIGNEEKITPEFTERFKYIYDKVKKAHPEIIIVGTAGPGSHKGNPDYDNAWKLADEIGLDIIDEHYYEPRSYFLTSHQYDSYPRTSLREPQDKQHPDLVLGDGDWMLVDTLAHYSKTNHQHPSPNTQHLTQVRKTKVYLGEYSVQEKSHGNQLADALAEALYLTGVEKNGDVVCMTSYAPLFAYKHNTNWNPDLIYFDNERPYLTCSYYVQQMFGESAGGYYYGDCVTVESGKLKVESSNLVGQSVVLSTKKGEVYVKVVNCSDETVAANVDLSRFSIKGKAEKVVLTGAPDAENNYDNHPVEPVRTQVKIKKKMTVEVPANTFLMYKIGVK